ncbi:Ubiquitin-conjugating enzyme E2 J1 [Fusarium oxysporum f. sp. albedinis]|nr:Ubiquitin-conjugating enzyme E2 J1 [Fusarium oxysporum f. sp. albedinis]
MSLNNQLILLPIKCYSSRVLLASRLPISRYMIAQLQMILATARKTESYRYVKVVKEIERLRIRTILSEV